ncbi:MAG: zf-HC2 domain-containing protein [Pyrinomonadaceae bacterium]|nr:zf-HC2 domain-containing protein [Pyrinomonadaceae bacterium]
MKCENLQLNLSIYLDDILTGEERAVLNEHLVRCPLCRQKLADFQSLRAGLRVLPRPELSDNVLALIRNRVERAAESRQTQFLLPPVESFQEWLQKRLMPYAVGTAASLIFGLTLLWSLLSAAYIPEKNVELARFQPPVKSSVLLANSNSRTFALESNFDLNAADYAASRTMVSSDSPSLNPQGALVALTRSIVRGKMKDEEVVIVADIFGSGLAQIAEVVEPSGDIRAVAELEKALKNDPNLAPFVPASFDNRSETVRVIFKINRVDVDTNPKPKSKNK